jgi:hypothetical protein
MSEAAQDSPMSPRSKVPDMPGESGKKNTKTKRQYGFLRATIKFLEDEAVLSVRIIEVRELKPCSKTGNADPYIKCYLLPDASKKSKKKTSILTKTLNPWWDEEISWRLDSRVLQPLAALSHARWIRVTCKYLSGIEVPWSCSAAPRFP